MLQLTALHIIFIHLEIEEQVSTRGSFLASLIFTNSSFFKVFFYQKTHFKLIQIGIVII